VRSKLMLRGPPLDDLAADSSLSRSLHGSRKRPHVDMRGILSDSSSVLFQGVLEKKRPRGFMGRKIWQKRFVILTRRMVVYGKSSDSEVLGQIPLKKISSVRLQPWKKGGSRFDICLKDNIRVFSFQAETSDLSNEWVEKIRDAVSAIRTDDPPIGEDLTETTAFEDTEMSQTGTLSAFSAVDVDSVRQSIHLTGPTLACFQKLLEVSPEMNDDIRKTSTDSSHDISDLIPAQMQLMAHHMKVDYGKSFRGSMSLQLKDNDPAIFSQFSKLISYGVGPFGKIDIVEKKIGENSQRYYMIMIEQVMDKSVQSRTHRAMECLSSHLVQHSFLVTVKHHGTDRYGFRSWWALPYPSCGNLYQHLKTERRFPEDAVLLIGAGMTLLLSHLHEFGYLLPALDPEHVFLDSQGFACLLDLQFTQFRLGEGVKCKSILPEYATPESIQGQEESFQADFWRLGCLLYELAVGVPAFRAKKDQKLEERILKGAPKFPPFVSDEFKGLVSSLLQVDFRERLGFKKDCAEVINHPFFSNIDWTRLYSKKVTVPSFLEKLFSNAQKLQELIPGDSLVSHDKLIVESSDIQKTLNGTLKRRKRDVKVRKYSRESTEKLDAGAKSRSDSSAKESLLFITLPEAKVGFISRPSMISVDSDTLETGSISFQDSTSSPTRALSPISVESEGKTENDVLLEDNLSPSEKRRLASLRRKSRDVSTPGHVSPKAQVDSEFKAKSSPAPSRALPEPPSPISKSHEAKPSFTESSQTSVGGDASLETPETKASSVSAVESDRVERIVVDEARDIVPDFIPTPIRNPTSPRGSSARRKSSFTRLDGPSTGGGRGSFLSPISSPSSLGKGSSPPNLAFDSSPRKLREKRGSVLQTVSDKLRAVVSKKKKRFRENGFDLDLSYITERIIAMGFPTEGDAFESVYRNPMEEVQRFFQTFHFNHFKVYNLCSERSYHPERFNYMIERFPFDDHNPPPFSLMEQFCQDVNRYLLSDPENVVSVHCKAGKGRSGTMIAALLVYMKVFENAEAALDFFGKQRTENGKGVTIHSQRRYVHYFEEYLKKFDSIGKPFPWEGIRLSIKSLRISPIPKTGLSPFFVILNSEGKKVFDSAKKLSIESFKAKDACADFRVGCNVRGDFKIVFYNKFTLQSKKIFWCWLNTNFVHDYYLCLEKTLLDGIVKDGKHKKFPKELKLEIFLEEPADMATEISSFEVNDDNDIEEELFDEDEGDEDEDEEESKAGATFSISENE